MGERTTIFISLDDIKLWGVALGFILLSTAIIQLGSKSYGRIFYWRKALHILAIGTCGFVINHSQNTLALGYLLLLLGIVLLAVVKYQFLEVSKGESWGIALFPLALGILLVGNLADVRYIGTSAYVLALADAAAGIVGNRFGHKKRTPLSEEKSNAGSLAFFLMTLLVIMALHPFFYVKFTTLLLICLVITCGELFSSKGSDNATIPLLTALLLQQLNSGSIYEVQAWMVLLVSALVLPLMMKKRWLNKGGALAAMALALSITLFLPWHFLIYPVIFLGSGSLLSRLNRQEKREKDGRNAIQVFANGGVALLLLFLFKADASHLYILVFSIAMADTFSSEIGRYIGGKTWDILTFQPMPVGLSGGISLQGSIAGLLAGFALPMLAYLCRDILLYEVLLIGLASFLGMILDSLLGSGLQAKFTLDKQVSEVKKEGAVLSKGYALIDNDVVNFLSILSAVTLYAFIF